MERTLSIVATYAIALVLSGCETIDETPTVSATVPTSSLIGSGPPISSNYMSSYCRGELATRNMTNPTHVRTRSPAKQADGSTTVEGRVDKGAEGTRAFTCRFDPKGAFVDVIPMELEAAL